MGGDGASESETRGEREDEVGRESMEQKGGG